MGELTAHYLRDILDYNPLDGAFRWKITRNARSVAGSLAGSEDGRHRIQIELKGKKYYAHRLAFLFMTGEWPVSEVDHRDGYPGNNAWSNLRVATRSLNIANCGKRKNTSSPFKGVSLFKQTGKWKAQIEVDGKNRHLGLFASPEEAHAAYLAAAKDAFGQFARAS
jgi:hypothetical protein